MRIINEKIKQLYGTKADFCQKEGHGDPKDLSKKIRTVQAKLDWLNVFLKPLRLGVLVINTNLLGRSLVESQIRTAEEEESFHTQWSEKGLPEKANCIREPLLVMHEGRQGTGFFHAQLKDWDCYFPGYGKERLGKVDAWRTYPGFGEGSATPEEPQGLPKPFTIEGRPHFDFNEEDKSLYIKHYGEIKPGTRVRVHDTAFSKRAPKDVLSHIYHEGEVTGGHSDLSSHYSVNFAYRVDKVVHGDQVTCGEGIKTFNICRDLSALRYVKLI